jgi:hypothetical protein
MRSVVGPDGSLGEHRNQSKIYRKTSPMNNKDSENRSLPSCTPNFQVPSVPTSRVDGSMYPCISPFE